MTTLSKACLFKPKLFFTVFSGSSLLSKPKNFNDAKCIVELEDVMKLECEALLKNGTYELIECPKDSSTVGMSGFTKLKSEVMAHLTSIRLD